MYVLTVASCACVSCCSNVFVIGKGDKPLISLPKGKGIRQTILQEQAKLYGKTATA
jgi:hypothetical protein